MESQNGENNEQFINNNPLLPHLEVISGSDRGLIVSIRKKRFIVGRKVGDLVLTDTKISSAHFALEENQDVINIIDLDSTNGTKLNGQDIKMATIREGDVIGIGNTEIKFIFKELTHADENTTHDDSKIDLNSNSSDQDEIDKTAKIEDSEQKIIGSLKIVEGNDTGVVFPIKNEKTVIGRISADINLNDESVLRKHAMLEITQLNVLLRDLSNEEGIYVNGRRVMNCRLKGNEKITLGKTTLEFNFD